MRDLSTELEAAFTDGGAMVALLGEFEFESETLRLWTGYGQIVYNGNTYIGGGNLIAISPYQETQDLQAQGLRFSLSGITSDSLSLAFQEEYQGNPCRLYIATIDEDRTVISAYKFFTGIMDFIDVSDDGKESKLILSAENIMTQLKRVKVSRYTDEDQKSKYPTDQGLSLISQLQDKELVW